MSFLSCFYCTGYHNEITHNTGSTINLVKFCWGSYFVFPIRFDETLAMVFLIEFVRIRMAEPFGVVNLQLSIIKTAIEVRINEIIGVRSEMLSKLG